MQDVSLAYLRTSGSHVCLSVFVYVSVCVCVVVYVYVWAGKSLLS